MRVEDDKCSHTLGNSQIAPDFCRACAADACNQYTQDVIEQALKQIVADARCGCNAAYVVPCHANINENAVITELRKLGFRASFKRQWSSVYNAYCAPRIEIEWGLEDSNLHSWSMALILRAIAVVVVLLSIIAALLIL